MMTNPIPLTHTTTWLLKPCPPFHFDGTVWKASYFPGSDTAFEPGTFWQSMLFTGSYYGIRMENRGTVEEPAVELTIFSTDHLAADRADAIMAEISCRYDIDADLRAFYDGYAQDALLAPVLARWRGVRPSSYTSLYEYLVIATTLQNATVRRTVQMMENLFAHYGVRLAFDGRVFSGFWPPEAIQAASEDDLRAIKLGYRAKTLKRQAQCFAGSGANGGAIGGPLEETRLRALSTPDLKRALLSIYGIGPASVWYLLFGQFKRYDAFETISPWEQKIYSRLLYDQELVDGKTILTEVDRRWGPYKMLAAHLIFEDLFWRRKNEPVPWLEALIRL